MAKRALSIAPWILLLCGLCLIFYSSNMTAYENGVSNIYDILPEEYEYDSKKYFEFRDSQVTNKYVIQDYGAGLALISLYWLVLLTFSTAVLPSSFTGLVAIALIAVFGTSCGFVFDLLRTVNRQEAPWWADSIGIPLMGLPLIFGGTIVWAAMHLWLYKKPIAVVTFHLQALLKMNFWLKFVTTLTFLLLGIVLYERAIGFAIAGFAWMHFYISLACMEYEVTSNEKF